MCVGGGVCQGCWCEVCRGMSRGMSGGMSGVLVCVRYVCVCVGGGMSGGMSGVLVCVRCVCGGVCQEVCQGCWCV